MIWVCVCSLRYAACNTHAPCYQLWPAGLYNVFAHYLTKGTTFGKKKSYWTQNVFWFSLQSLSDTFVILRTSQRDTIQMSSSLRVKFPSFLSDFNKNWIFSQRIFDKFSHIEFHENPSSESRVVPYGRTDKTMLTVAFRNFANAPIIFFR